MKYKIYVRAGLLLLLTLLVILVSSTLPAHAATRLMRTQRDTTPLSARIYLTNGTLAPIFQSRVNQQVPGVVSAAIASIVSKLPATDQGWASTMATTVIQPSVLLTSLVPTQSGLVASIRISLYAGDPQPINARLLIKFSVLDSSTVQVSVQPMPGSPNLINGPITTLHIPIGQLNGINATPGCGDSSLAVNLQVPLSLGGQVASTQSGQVISNSVSAIRERHTQTLSSAASGGTAYVEISSASLSALGNSLGSFPIGSNNMSAQNLQVSVQGSNIVVTSDILLGSSFKLGTAVTTVQPTATGGKLAVNVLSTTLTVLQVFTFPQDTYNAQIQQMLNARLGTALTGKFNVSSAAIGTNSHVPCSASDSLVLTGTTNLV